MTPLEQRGAAILRRLPAKSRMAEVGVLTGRLSEYILRNSDVHVLMVDNWQTVDNQPETYKATRDTHALHTDAARVASHRAQSYAVAGRYHCRAEIREGWSTEVARGVPDGSLDMVFLDADHSYEGARADIAAWVPKVRKGGWIGGHDYGNGHPDYDFSGVKRAVDEVFGAVETDENFTWFHQCG